MSKLTQAIGPQGYEVISAKIFEILGDELSNQYTLQPTVDVLNSSVWLERQTQFNTDELPALSIKYIGSNYDNHDVQDKDGANTFNIDCYVPGKASAEYKGDQQGILDLKRLLGVISSILSAPVYAALDFNPNTLVKSRRVLNIAISEPDANQDSLNVMMGRLTFRVDGCETTEGIQPKDLAAYCTTVKLYETELGYLYKRNKHVFEDDVFEDDVFE